MDEKQDERCGCRKCAEDRVAHASDCAVHNEPAYPAGPCDCEAISTTPMDCPKCLKSWPTNCEQAICVELFGECVSCRRHKISSAEIDRIQALQEERGYDAADEVNRPLPTPPVSE